MWGGVFQADSFIVTEGESNEKESFGIRSYGTDVCQLGVFAFADTQECTQEVYVYNNDVSTPSNPGSYGITDNGDSVSVNGSTITVSGDDYGIVADNSTVTVNDSKITVNSGEYCDGICASDSTLNVNNSTISTNPSGCSLWGVEVGTSTVNINNSKITTSTDDGYGVYAYFGSTVTIKDSTIESTGEGESAAIQIGDTTNLKATDSVIKGTNGVVAYEMEEDTVIILDSTVISTGTKEDGNAALAVSFEENTNPDQVTIIVDKLQVTNDAALVYAEKSGTDVTEAVAEQISYIMHSIENATVEGTAELQGYNVAKEGKTLTVTVANGYELENNSQYAHVDKNADGTYTITVNRGGDLYFTARVKYVPAAYTTTTVSVTTNAMKGNKNDATQPVMVVNMKASHFQKVMVDGTDLAEGSFVVGEKDNGLLTFQFSTGYIKSLAAGTYSLQFVTTENVTHTMKLVVAEVGTYTVSY